MPDRTMQMSQCSTETASRITQSRNTVRRIAARTKASDFFFQAEDGIRDLTVTGVQTCALPIYPVLARDLRHRSPRFPLLQNRHDLRFGEPRLLHWTSLQHKILPEKSSSCCLPKIGRASCRERV